MSSNYGVEAIPIPDRDAASAPTGVGVLGNSR